MKKSLLTILLIFMTALIAVSQVNAADAVKRGGILKINYPSPSRNFGDPVNTRGGVHTFADPCLEGFVQWSNDNIGDLEPVLATSWELSPDRSSYTFKLREGVKFHDGTDFDAKAAKWNLDRWIASKTPVINVVESAEVVDKYTIKCNLSNWHSLIIAEMAKVLMISPTAFETHETKWVLSHPVGTGPFMITRVKEGQYCEYDKNPDYWQKGLPYLDGLKISQVMDYMTASASLLAGQVDVLVNLDVPAAEQLKGRGHSIFKGESQSFAFVFASNDPNSIWADKRMREALEYAIDKETVIKTIGRGYHPVSYEIINGINNFSNPKTEPRKYDPKKAKALMAEAGYPNGIKTIIKYTHIMAKDFLMAIQGSLAESGIQISNVQFEPGATFRQNIFGNIKGDTIYLEAKHGGYPLSNIKDELSSGVAWMPGLKRPEGINELCDKALNEMAPEKITSIVNQVEELAYEDAMFVPIWANKALTAYNPQLKGTIWHYGGQPFTHYERAWLDK